MHRYLRAIGFSGYFSSEYDIELFLDEIMHSYQERSVVRLDEHRTFLQFTKSFGPNFGICLCGEMDEFGFHRLYYYPYLKGHGITTECDLSIEKKISGNGYMGMVDDGRVGISLIFAMQNTIALQRRLAITHHLTGLNQTTLSGLSDNGVILLPAKGYGHPLTMEEKEENKRREQLVFSASQGDQEAIETLTLEDMDTYAMISRRIQHEDILTIVSSFMMPYGIECDQYQVLGTILFFTKVYNIITKEAVYQMTLEINDMEIDICISEKDLMGEPETGRRFKGNVWLLGEARIQ